MPRCVSYHFARRSGFSDLKNRPPIPRTFCILCSCGGSAEEAVPCVTTRSAARIESRNRSFMEADISIAGPSGTTLRGTVQVARHLGVVPRVFESSRPVGSARDCLLLLLPQTDGHACGKFERVSLEMLLLRAG